MALTGPALHRIRQGLIALHPRVPADCDEMLSHWLTPSQAVAFRQLPNHDQAHLLRVYRELLAHGVTDPDLLAAGLLHDLGKSSPAGRVRLVDRTAKVLLSRVAPGMLARLARPPGPKWRHGLHLAVHHPLLGAERASVLGCSDRTCWLIAHHEAADTAGDDDLALLISIDRSVP